MRFRRPAPLGDIAHDVAVTHELARFIAERLDNHRGPEPGPVAAKSGPTATFIALRLVQMAGSSAPRTSTRIA